MLQNQNEQTNANIERYRDRLTKFSSEFELGLFIFIFSKYIK